MLLRDSPDHSVHHVPDALLRLFVLGYAAQSAFGSLITQAGTDAVQSALENASFAVGLDASDIDIPDSVLTHIASHALDSAASIVSHYNADLEAEAQRFAQSYKGPQFDDALEEDLLQWAKSRAQWKSEQIAFYETQYGYSTGTDWMVSDILDGTLALSDGLDMSAIILTVEPAESSKDSACGPYAGNTYTLDQADEIMGRFPAHINCIHYVTVSIS